MKRLITTLMILVVTAMSASAANEQKMNVLNSIEIDSLKDTYNITLDTKSELNMKRTIQSTNNMILTLKNIKPSKSLNTIYKNAAEVDSVMVEPVGDNSLNIIIQANNIANSAVTFNTEEATLEASNSKSVLGATSTAKKSKKHSNKDKIVLSAPVDAYAPVYQEEFDEEDLDSEGPMSGLIAMIKNFLGQGNISNIVSTGLIGIILFCGIKLFKKEEPETAIGLAQSFKDRELSLYKDMSMRGGVVGPMSLERPQESLNIQRPQVQKQPIAPQVAKPAVNAKAGYGMRAYQASSKNPYMSADNSMMQRPVSSAQVTGQAQAPQSRILSTVGSRVNQNKMNLGINRPVQNMSAPVAKASNIDSMKFLESMTQIYEKNGRSDLAQGLKAGMLKAKGNV